MQMLRKDAMEDETNRRLMDIAIREATRLDNIITEFLQYARPPALDLAERDLNKVLAETLDLVQHEARTRSKIKIVTSLATGALTALVDQDQLRQVFWNMATNAFEAMPEGGQLTISTSSRHVDAGGRKGDVIEIAFQDTGEGIPKQNLDKIFLPFFTTKKEGSGLGLAAVHRIFDLVITDLRMPKADGMAVLKAVKSSSPETVVLVITAFATADSAVDAMKQGAYDYLTKPFQVDEVQLIIRNALERRRLSTENILLKREMASQSSFAQIVGQSEGMLKVFDVVRKVADAKSNVLICGESGTGKELVARAIHYNSVRSPMPFVAVNCSAVPETLLESELFGHMKGSFTGAMANKAGLFEVANGGTIFLGGIGDTTPTIQIKLLRAIQEREIRRGGGHQGVKVCVRTVAAANKEFEKA